MIYVKHRVNRIADLASIRPGWGAEIDLRSCVSEPGRLHLSHDAWTEGDDFEAWLEEFKQRGIQGPLILNTKEDGLESRVWELLKKYGVSNSFFLDTALPTLVRWSLREGRKDFAVRVSKYEPASWASTFALKAEWIWLDCFDGEPLVLTDELRTLKKSFKVCIVSPELQGHALESTGRHFSELFLLADAICTKAPEWWISNQKASG